STGKWILPTPYRNGAKPGENGWIKGFTFWRDNITHLPRLFYLKMWKNYWYDGGSAKNRLRPEGVYLIGIGFLLLALGFRQTQQVSILLSGRIKSPSVVLFQLSLIALLFLFWNAYPFWVIILVWSVISMVALLCPYGDYYRLCFPSPTWFLAFIV